MRGCGRTSTTFTSGRRRNPPLLAANKELGPSQYSTDYRRFAIDVTLQPGTRYYWKIVSKTMAHVTADGPVWSFTTAGTAPNNTPPTVSITSPASGATFTAPESIALTASALDSDGTIAFVEFFAGSTWNRRRHRRLRTAPAWTNVPAGTYHFTAVATDSGNASTTSDLLSITVNPGEPPPAGLPSGWSAADVGATGATGQSRFSDGTFTITGAGADVWGTADQFRAQVHHADWRRVHRCARRASTQFVHAWTKAGVMIRSSLSPSAAHAFQLVGIVRQRRSLPASSGGWRRVGQHAGQPVDGAALGEVGPRREPDYGLRIGGRRDLDHRRQRHVHDGVGGVDWPGGIESCDRRECDGDVRHVTVTPENPPPPPPNPPPPPPN